MSEEKVWVRSHRTFGFELARTTAPAGREYVILQTDTHKEEVCFAHMLLPVSQQEREFEVRMLLVDAVLRARFLGINAETVTRLLDEELKKEV